MPLRKYILAAALIMGALAPVAQAREIAPAVEIEPIGFSADGRYFAYEEILVGDGNSGPAYLVHVLDRTTNQPESGFPFGIPESEESDPAKPGDNKWKRIGLSEDNYTDMPETFEKLRADVRRLAAQKLEAFGITARPRRVAGIPYTQIAPFAPALSFKLHGELLGGIPDQQPVYRLRAHMQAEGAKCYNEPLKKSAKNIALTLETFTARNGRMGAKPESTTRKSVSFMADDECPQAARISDIFAAPSGDTSKQAFVAILFVHSWRSHADSSRLLATFFDVQ